VTGIFFYVQVGLFFGTWIAVIRHGRILRKHRAETEAQIERIEKLAERLHPMFHILKELERDRKELERDRPADRDSEVVH
jgi:hypothetical protein